MANEVKLKKIIIGIGSLLVISWGVYSVFFQRFYQDVVFFTTDGAPKLIQLLELIGYRGEEMMPYLSVFFALTTLSLLFCIYLSFATRNKQDKRLFTRTAWLLLSLIVAYNIFNKLGALLLVLVIVAALLMYSLVATINYLYLDNTKYEVGDVLHTEGPFETEENARIYSKEIVRKRKEEFYNVNLLLTSDIYMGESKNYYVDIYLEASDE